jgi:hypothetical protein
MNTLSEEQRKLLLEHHRAPCISMYLPTHQAGAEIQHDRIRLKQQTRQAENLLFLANVPAAQVENLLEPIGALLDDEAFWLCPSAGLALFRSPDLFHPSRLPCRCKELVVVGSHFYLKPLPTTGTMQLPGEPPMISTRSFQQPMMAALRACL